MLQICEVSVIYTFEAIFRIEATEPYPHSNGGQKLGLLEVLPISDPYIHWHKNNYKYPNVPPHPIMLTFVTPVIIKECEN